MLRPILCVCVWFVPPLILCTNTTTLLEVFDSESFSSSWFRLWCERAIVGASNSVRTCVWRKCTFASRLCVWEINASEEILVCLTVGRPRVQPNGSHFKHSVDYPSCKFAYLWSMSISEAITIINMGIHVNGPLQQGKCNYSYANCGLIKLLKNNRLI